MVAQDLRTHLTVIKWYLEMIFGGKYGTLRIAQVEFLKQIEEANQRAIDLLEKTKDLAEPGTALLTQKAAPGGAA